MEADKRVRFFVTVEPQTLKALSLGKLDAGIHSTPIATLLKNGNFCFTGTDSQNFKISKLSSSVKKAVCN